MNTILVRPAIAACALAFGLSSCVMTDPTYMKEVALIQNVDYPMDKISGEWMQAGFTPFTPTNPLAVETRVYLKLKPDGSGFLRFANVIPALYSEFPDVINVPQGDTVGEMELPLRWSSLGANRWQISYDTANRRITSHPAWYQPKPVPLARPSIVRYHNGRLFDLTYPCTLVSMADETAVRSHISDMRRLYMTNLRNQMQMKRALKQQITVPGATGAATQTTAPTPSASAVAALSYATPVPAQQGFVYPPGATMSPEYMVDVRSFTRGQQVSDPRTGQTFLVP